MGKSSDDLVRLIDRWIAEKPSRRDIAMLSEMSGVHYNTVRRVHQGGNPDCHTALSILGVITSKEESIGYLREHFPGAARFLEPLYKNSEHESVPSMRVVVRDSLSYLITNLAYGELATRAEIGERYGTKGLEVADSLCSLGKTHWVGDQLRIVSGAKYGLYENKEDVAMGCHHITDWSLEHGGYPMAMVGSVTLDEFNELESMTTEYVNGVTQRLTKSKGGGILVAISSVFTKVFHRGGDQ